MINSGSRKSVGADKNIFFLTFFTGAVGHDFHLVMLQQNSRYHGEIGQPFSNFKDFCNRKALSFTKGSNLFGKFSMEAKNLSCYLI